MTNTKQRIADYYSFTNLRSVRFLFVFCFSGSLKSNYSSDLMRYNVLRKWTRPKIKAWTGNELDDIQNPLEGSCSVDVVYQKRKSNWYKYEGWSEGGDQARWRFWCRVACTRSWVGWTSRGIWDEGRIRSGIRICDDWFFPPVQPTSQKYMAVTYSQYQWGIKHNIKF